jgi:hypothetical protein
MSESLQVVIEYAGGTFPFHVYCRDLLLGNAGHIDYYWMDGRQIRQGQGGPNFRPCVDLWWRAVEAAGEARELDNEFNLVLAECYPLVNTARAVQDIYLDAHLHPTADREYVIAEEDGIRRVRSDRTYLLPEDECQRLRGIARTRDINQIRAELESLFLGELPPQEELPAYQEAARAWLGNGAIALRREGREGLRRYTGEIDEWIRSLRRRGNLDRVRMFLNMFSYECKVAFYTCYCSAWVAILRWLAENREPNTTGERFMRIWHHQNRASDAGEVHRDVFCGQVLAIHPLSAVVLSSPEHLAVIGNWLGHRDYETLYASNRFGQCDEYWDFVATILIAAHEYDRSRRRWDERRGQPTRAASDRLPAQARDDSVASARVLFEDFAAARGLHCPRCSGPLDYVRYETPPDGSSGVAVSFRCRSCGEQTTVPVERGDVAG